MLQAAPPVDATAKYFEQLRRRRLFSVAEGYCIQRLTQESVPTNVREALTLELSRTFVEHAKYTAGAEQAELWKRATQEVDEFLAKNPKSSKRLLLQVQAAFIPASQGEFLRWQSELFPDKRELRQQAQTALKLAVSRLNQLHESLDARIRDPLKHRDPQRIPTRELEILRYNVRLRLAVGLLDQAKLLPTDSADRMSNLIDVQALLRRLIGGVSVEAMYWHSRVLLAQCSRLRGDLKAAVGMLTEIAADKPPEEVLDQIKAERVRLLLTLKKPADAATILAVNREPGARFPGELRFLNVKALVSLWEIAARKNDSDLSDELWRQVESHVDRAEREVGGYWGYRCRLLLEFAKEARRYGRVLVPLVRKARASYAEGRIDDAIQQYGEAAEAADREAKTDLAMELGYTRASIQVDQKQYAEAAASLRDLTVHFPTSQKAADAHLLWAFCLGKLYGQQQTNKARRTAYADALNRHLDKFANHQTAVEATWMLARLEESASQVTRALNLYLRVPANSRRGPDSQVAAARCYEQILQILRDSQQPAADWENYALDRLGQIVAAYPAGPTVLSRQQAEVVLRLARIQLNRGQPDFSKAERLLMRVFSSWGHLKASLPSSDKQTEQSWKPLLTTATQLQIISLAGQPDPKPKQALALLQNLSEANTADLLSVLDGLVQLVSHSNATTRRSLGALQLQAAKTLQARRSELTAAQQSRLDRCRAQAYLATNQPRTAVKIYEQLVKASPRDKKLRRQVAELLVECGTPECLKKAKTNWRKLESLEKAGSPAWMEIRYQVIWCYFALKQNKDCQKQLDVTRLLYPKLGGEKLRDRFTKLERALKQRRDTVQ